MKTSALEISSFLLVFFISEIFLLNKSFFYYFALFKNLILCFYFEYKKICEKKLLISSFSDII